MDYVVVPEVERIVKGFVGMPLEFERLVLGEVGMAAELELERD